MDNSEPKTVINENLKEVGSKLLGVGKTVLHWGWVPLIFYLGMKSEPKPNLFSLVGVVTRLEKTLTNEFLLQQKFMIKILNS
ncbi:import receptor subunit tom7 [Anaeramoeba flamelloides]|uniref:Import receptor subunit tom7 n=1 Tax=Anaeramoeba flamelloides TaxID=1746091 RepID=A0AAV7Y4R0_9EUKA|nr:import receptor subunit tom7 [Anaeramoeba flamelloides]